MTSNYLTQVGGSTAELGLYAEDLPPRLRSFKRRLDIENQIVPYEDFVDLRSILTAFRSNIHLGLSVPRERLERLIVKENPNRRRLLLTLEQRGVIVSGEWYQLIPRMMDQIGFSLADVKGGTPSPGVLKFLISCRSDPSEQ